MSYDLCDILDILEEIIVRNEITKNSNMEQISKQFSSAKDHEKHRKKHRERGSWMKKWWIRGRELRDVM